MTIAPVRALEAELRQSQRLEAIGQLAAGVAHDFNNLLMVMLANAELAQEHPDVGPFASEIVDAGTRARELTRQLLAFGRQSTMQVEGVDLTAALLSASKLFARTIGERIQFVVHSDDAPAIVAADRSLVTQVLLNLVVNARDAMPGGGVLTISKTRKRLGACDVARWVDVAPGPFIALEVRDTGTGMSDAVMARVFEPFFTTKSAGMGTGLGLSTAFGLVAQWKGAIEVSSRMGEGTAFTVYLPERVDAVIEKPFRHEELMQKIHQCLELDAVS